MEKPQISERLVTAVGLFSVADAQHINVARGIIDRIHDSVISLSDAVQISRAFQFLHAVRARIVREIHDLLMCTGEIMGWEASQLLASGGNQRNVIGAHPALALPSLGRAGCRVPSGVLWRCGYRRRLLTREGWPIKAAASSWRVGVVVSPLAASVLLRAHLRWNARLRLLVCLVLAWAWLCHMPWALAASNGPAKEDAVTVTSKTVTGELDLIMPKFINMIYDRKGGTEYEMELPYDANLKVVNRRSVSELKRGDIVSVKYDEQSWVDGKEMEHKSRKATEVMFLKTAVKGLRSEE